MVNFEEVDIRRGCFNRKFFLERWTNKNADQQLKSAYSMYAKKNNLPGAHLNVYLKQGWASGLNIRGFRERPAGGIISSVS